MTFVPTANGSGVLCNFVLYILNTMYLFDVQRNTGQTTAQLQSNDDSGNDLRVEPAWIQGYTGCGIVVGVVDDG